MKPRERNDWRPSRGGPWPVVQTGGEFAPGEREWLHTNGAGAYAMSSIALLHTRRHHGAFVAALDPPLGRHVIVSHADTIVSVDDDRRSYRIATHQFPNVAPTLGYRLIEYFAIDPVPRWTYRLGQHTLERTLSLARGRNACIFAYTWYGKSSARIAIRPLMPLRPIGALTTEHGGMMQVVTLRAGAVELRPVPHLPPVHFSHEGMFMGSPDWWRKFEYLMDRSEGKPYQEDMWTPGVFELALEPGRTAYLACAVGAPLDRAPAELMAEMCEFLRSQDLGPKRTHAVRVLGLAAEQFCLDAVEPRVITPGYPSHRLYVRDIALAVPGLLLAREQTQRAEGVLRELISHQRFGLLPEIVPRPGERRSKPLPDATLWLFETGRLLLARRGVRDPFIAKELFPALVRAFVRFTGRTRRWVWRSLDGLLVTGEPNVAVTWMDARVDGSPVTARTGVAIEHQALFTRGCDVLSALASFYGHDALAARVNDAALRARSSFRARFWCQDTEYPYDCVSEARDRTDAWADSSIRPNALIALAIDPTLFEDWQADAILQRVRSELLTPVAVRSLSPQDRRYIGNFGGSSAERESAYHQGTGWTHLLGVYARAAHHQWGDEPAGREELVQLLESAVDHGPLFGQMPQLADGDEPFRARGCPAQATAVAEVLRALVELGASVYGLGTLADREAGMKPSPQLLGVAFGVLVAGGFVAWRELRPAPCTGGVFLELRPPLAEAGPYHFRLTLDGGPEVCEFDLSLPVRGGVSKRQCPRALELETRVQEGVTSLVGLALGASPDELALRVTRGSDTIYDTALALRYSPYAVRREDERRFCGDRAFAKPACRRGSPECLPFHPNCDGPEDCQDGKSCCANPEQGREYGAQVATECRFRRGCLDGFGRIACHGDAECPADMACDGDALAKDFSPALRTCRERAPAPAQKPQ